MCIAFLIMFLSTFAPRARGFPPQAYKSARYIKKPRQLPPAGLPEGQTTTLS